MSQPTLIFSLEEIHANDARYQAGYAQQKHTRHLLSDREIVHLLNAYGNIGERDAFTAGMWSAAHDEMVSRKRSGHWTEAK